MSKIISGLKNFFRSFTSEDEDSEAERGRGFRAWQWTKSRAKAPINFGVEAYNLYVDLKFHVTQNLIASRIDKTNECPVFASNRKLSVNGKNVEVPSFLKSLELKKKEKDELPEVIFNNKRYKLRAIRNGGKTVTDTNGNRLYEIIELKHGIIGAKKEKGSKVYGIWLDGNNELSDNNIAGQHQTYNFSGKVSSFSYIDRNIETGEKNLFTTLLVTWPLGISAAIIKYIGYYGADLIFNKLPRIIDRVILPVASAVVLAPIYILGMLTIFLLLDLPQGLIKKVFDPSFEVAEIYKKFSSPFEKALEFNQAVIKEGASGYIKKNVLEADCIESKVRAIKEGILQVPVTEERAIMNKYRLLKAMNAFSSSLNIANLAISNSSNIMASGLKGIANTVLYVTHGGDSAYWDAAKFLFIEPAKIMQQEFKEEFADKKPKVPSTFQREERVNEPASSAPSQASRGKGQEQNREQNFTTELKDRGQDLHTSGVKNLVNQGPVISYNASSATALSHGIHRNITRAPSPV